MSHICDKIIAAGVLFDREFPDINFVHGGLIGMDVLVYNKKPCEDGIQEQVNSSIVGVNKKIKDLNEAAGVPHVYFSSKVPRWERSVSYHRYHLLFDGLHLQYGVLKHWVKLIKSIHVCGLMLRPDHVI